MGSGGNIGIVWNLNKIQGARKGIWLHFAYIKPCGTVESSTVVLPELSMTIRNEILQLHRESRLVYGGVPMPPDDELRVFGMMPDILRRISDPDIFEFAWQGSGISIDAEYLVHYPTVEEWEWEEAMTCPVPHPHIWIETEVSAPHGAPDRIYIWDVTRDEGQGFTATPLVFDPGGHCLFYFATYLVVNRNEIDDLGRRGTVKVFNGLRKYADDFEIDEFYEHANMLARFLRILCHPKVIIDTKPAEDRLNRNRARRGKEPIVHRRTVRISEDALQYRAGGTGAGHASPKEHHRRAHKRRYANGRETTVRECVVNKGHGPELPLPQNFAVG